VKPSGVAGKVWHLYKLYQLVQRPGAQGVGGGSASNKVFPDGQHSFLALSFHPFQFLSALNRPSASVSPSERKYETKKSAPFPLHSWLLQFPNLDFGTCEPRNGLPDRFLFYWSD
jgi:hypothetical protein